MLFVFQFTIKLLIHFPFELHTEIREKQHTDDNCKHDGCNRAR